MFDGVFACRLPYTFVTTEVVEAACSCLLAQAEEAERLRLPEVVQERMVLEEFGRCIMQVIESANKTRGAIVVVVIQIRHIFGVKINIFGLEILYRVV